MTKQNSADVNISMSFSIELNPLQKLDVVYQNEPMCSDYDLEVKKTFDLDDNGAIDDEEVKEFVSNYLNNYLEENNINKYLLGVDYRVNVGKVTVHRLH